MSGIPDDNRTGNEACGCFQCFNITQLCKQIHDWALVGESLETRRKILLNYNILLDFRFSKL